MHVADLEPDEADLLASVPSSYYQYLSEDDPALKAKVPAVSDPQARELLGEVEQKFHEMVSLRLKVDESSRRLRHALRLQEGATLPSCIKEWVNKAFEGDGGTPARLKLDIRYDDQNRVNYISVNRRAEEQSDDVKQAGECVEQILCDCHVFLQRASSSQDRMASLCQEVLNLPSRQMATREAAKQAKNMCKKVKEFEQQCDSLLKNFLAAVPFLNRTAERVLTSI